MIDWLTLHVTLKPRVLDAWRACRRGWPSLMKLGRDGVVEWERTGFETLRSDHAHVTISPSDTGFTLCGSPSSAIGSNNVFGCSDQKNAVEVMLISACRCLRSLNLDIKYSDVKAVRVTRADITFNVLMDSQRDVDIILASLHNIETGRYRTTRKYGSSVYCGGKSRTAKAKVYNKGLHMEWLQKKNGDKIKPSELIDDGTLQCLKRVARLEVQIGRKFFAKNNYFETDLEAVALAYWDKLFGDETMQETMTDLQRIEAHASGKAQARNILRTLHSIRSNGMHAAREMMGEATWKRHLAALRKANFGEATLCQGATVIRFPLREILGRRVDSWAEFYQAVNG